MSSDASAATAAKSEELQKMTRRRFLGSAAVAGVAASAPDGGPKVAETDPERAKLEKIVAQYGSEIGNLRRVT